MTPKEHARDLMLRLSAIDGSPDEIVGLIVRSLEDAVATQREKDAQRLDTLALQYETTGMGLEATIVARCAAAIRKGE